MRFERAGDVEIAQARLPLGYVIDFGAGEAAGVLDEGGRFVQKFDADELPTASVIGLAPGLALAMPCIAEVRDESESLLALVEFGVVNGQAGCIGLRAASAKVLSGSLLRGLPLAQLAQRTVRANMVRLLRWNGALFAARFPTSAEETKAEKPLMRRVLSDAFLRDVAVAYREALTAGLPPALEVYRRFGTTPQNARRWIMLARRRDLLRPALGEGRRGEAI